MAQFERPVKRWQIRSVCFLFFSAIIIGAASVGMTNDSASGEAGAIFVDSGQSLGNTTTQAVAAADLDGVNGPDVFAANAGSNTVWLNNGSGQFTDSGENLGTAFGESVALANLDSDTDIDAVVANSDTLNQVWWNDGDGTFTAGPTFPSTSSRGVAVGNLNADDDPDIYIAEEGMDHIYWNNGDGTFTDSGQSLDTAPGYGVALEDLDGDGDLDVFVANGGSGSPFDTVWINQGGDQGGTEGDFLDSGQELGFIWTEDVALGDLGGPSAIDAFTASWIPQANKMWPNEGPAAFFDSGQNLGSEGSLGVSLGDVDGDLDLDAFVGNQFPDGGKLWINNGSGMFTDSGESIGADQTIQRSALADFNNDGALDLFLAVDGPNQVWFNSTGEGILPTVGFQHQIVDSRAVAGGSTSIALDTDGNPHIAYTKYQLNHEGRDNAIWYSAWDGVRWHRERLLRIGDALAQPFAVALELDSAGNPHIAFATGVPAPNAIISYAQRVDDHWDIEQLVSGGGFTFGLGVSMALDSQDNPHFVYISNQGINYQYFDGVNWTEELIDPDLNVGFNRSFKDFALDAADNPHVSYYSQDDQSLRYAHKVSGIWQLEIVDDDPVTVSSTINSIAIDNSGNPAIAYLWERSTELKIARWNGASWIIQTVHTAPAPFDLSRANSNDLTFDSAGRPHIIFASDYDSYMELTHIFWDGAQWVQRVIDNSGLAGRSASVALDSDDDVHVSYYDATQRDLRYAAWGPKYEIVTVNSNAAVATTALGIRDRIPSIGFYDLNSGLTKVADWVGEWLFDNIASSSNPVPQISAVNWLSSVQFSHYDADKQRLLYTHWDGRIVRSEVIDENGDVGRFNDITYFGANDLFIRIAYWDASNHRIKLAELNSLRDPPVIHVNDQTPALNADSGYVSITMLPSHNVGISYYDGVNGNLRYAAWDRITNTWVDRLVDGAGAETGRMSDIALDSTEGVPVMAYYDETADQIKMAYGNGPDFSYSVAVSNVADVTSLSLSLNMNSRHQARILYTTAGGNLNLAALYNEGWRVTNLVSGGESTRDASSLVLQNRLHFSYADSLQGLMYGFRSSNLDFPEQPGTDPTLGDGHYNPLQSCDTDDDDDDDDGSISAGLTGIENRLRAPQVLTGPLTDQEIFSGMTALFNITAAGRYYIGLYRAHGPEMGQIALDDPQLIWDSYGMLQNFMSGLEAFVTGDGDQPLIDQDMIDAALDIWTRIAAEAGPELAGVINTELAKYNNLQDFVGLSFDQWAEAIGVRTPATADVLFRDNFE